MKRSGVGGGGGQNLEGPAVAMCKLGSYVGTAPISDTVPSFLMLPPLSLRRQLHVRVVTPTRQLLKIPKENI